MAIAFAYLKSYSQVHIFCDSESAIENLTSPSGGRMANVNACRILRDWFERDPGNHLHLHYCPSHSGIEENDAIDAKVKHLARFPGELPRYHGTFPTSHAYIKSAITDDMLLEWQKLADAQPQQYWGHQQKPPLQINANEYRLTYIVRYSAIA